jgi:hypothetical protein
MPDSNEPRRRSPYRRDEEERPRRRSRDEEDEDFDDEEESEYRERDRRKTSKKKKGALETLVPLKNGLALGAYYCGVFSFIPLLGFVLGPIAVVLGILGMSKASKNPRVGGTGHAITGIILGAVGLVIWPILWFAFLGKLMK